MVARASLVRRDDDSEDRERELLAQRAIRVGWLDGRLVHCLASASNGCCKTWKNLMVAVVVSPTLSLSLSHSLTLSLSHFRPHSHVEHSYLEIY